ncbi:Amidohydrolase [Marivirga sericea]|uniref:Amidohydrolase n=1 Tax=Marivirga sericea TaxID=1028 RepID=A0A1X7KF71_9BACT|nr:amidohydrolase family protein [Marivirga sericea]SMG39620.1 Amidohydrolase [Marivirga sericea]
MNKLNLIIYLVLLSFFSENLKAQSEKYTGPIVDMHMHDYTEMSYAVRTAPDGTQSPSSLIEYHKALLEEINKFKIKRAVVSTIGGEDIFKADDLIIRGYYTSKPPTDTLDFIEKIESGAIEVFGEIGAIYGGYYLSDPGFDPFLKICERYSIPVGVHTSGSAMDITYQCCPNFRLKYGDPYTIEDVLAKYPKLKIYLMHAGGSFYEHALRLMTQYSQVYADLGVILWVDEQPMDYAEAFLSKAKKYNLIDRVLYGSDQMVWPHAIGKSIETLNSYDFLTYDDKRKIFYSNANNFLNR